MELTAEKNGELRQYLLGQLTPERATPFEQRLLTDAAFYDELSIAEDELIDRYLAGELAPVERERFETHFLLAPERQKKLRFARSLRRYVAAERAAPLCDATTATAADLPDDAASTDEREADASSSTPTPGKQNLFKLLFARPSALAFSLAATLLVVTGVSWLWAVNRPARHVPRNAYAVTLTPGLTRGDGGGLARVNIPADADTLRLRLELPADEHPAYRAELQTVESRPVHASGDLKAVDADGRRVVELNVPSESVTAGDYRLRLSGMNSRGEAESVSSYTFRVVGR